MNPRVRLTLAFAVLGILWGILSALAPPALGDGDNDLAAKVKLLVPKLADPEEKNRQVAEAALLKLGPAILDYLPGPDAKLSKEQLQHLASIRATLQNAQGLKELVPSSVTIHNKTMPLSQALKELAQQTKIEVQDSREPKDDDPALNLELDKVTFWQALDTIAKEADLRIHLARRDGKIILMNGPHQAQPVSYSGLFRTTVKKMVVTSDLDAASHLCTIHLEIAWEPRFQPLFLETQADSLVAQDDKGLALKSPERPGGRGAVNERLSTEMQLRIEAPARSVSKLGLLQGTVSILGPSKMLTFAFDHLAKTQKGKDPPKQTKEGVTVTMSDFTIEAEDRWKVDMVLDYPPGGPEFESFESWLVNNDIHLEKDAGKTQFPLNGSYEIDSLGGTKTSITYRFVEENDKILGKPEDWKLVYKTPGAIVKLPIQFEFKDLPLP